WPQDDLRHTTRVPCVMRHARVVLPRRVCPGRVTRWRALAWTAASCDVWAQRGCAGGLPRDQELLSLRSGDPAGKAHTREVNSVLPPARVTGRTAVPESLVRVQVANPQRTSRPVRPAFLPAC